MKIFFLNPRNIPLTKLKINLTYCESLNLLFFKKNHLSVASYLYLGCGGAGGNRTPVRKHSTESSTCLAIVVFV